MSKQRLPPEHPSLEARVRHLVAEELLRILHAQPEPAPEIMTAEQVAEFLGVDRKTVYDYANRDQIPHRRLGKRLLFGHLFGGHDYGSETRKTSPPGGGHFPKNQGKNVSHSDSPTDEISASYVKVEPVVSHSDSPRSDPRPMGSGLRALGGLGVA